MQHDTPFFQGFSSILFGRPAVSGLEQKLRDVAALNTLSDFFATFGFLIPDALLRSGSLGNSFIFYSKPIYRDAFTGTLV